ncbi:MAG TPA: penicillin-binding transpeptidase domain-containing protein [Solirubrobacteraceae bacterium]
MSTRVGSPGGRPPSPSRQTAARRARLHRTSALLAICGLAFVIGAVVGARHTPAGEAHAKRFAQAWARGDYAAMYSELTPGERDRISRLRFTGAYQSAMRTATATKVVTGKPRKDGDVYRVPVSIPTRAFGTVDGEVVLPTTGEGVDWSRALVFPGLAAGERLRRVTQMPPRATLLARDRTVLATGDDRASSSPVATQVVGSLGPIPPERRAELARLGVPSDAEVGVSGLERIFDDRLIGRPGGELLAGTRVLRRTQPQQAQAVRTTISLPVEQAAVTALGGRLGGVVAIQPRTGEVLGFAGIGFSGLQPPGSTFKMITTTGALEAGITNPSKVYPVQQKAVLEGVDLENANGEYCGGTLLVSFAKSCNSVFAPLGAQLGAKRLVDVAQRYGFNQPPDIVGAAESTIPAPGDIGDDLAVGSSAIGQGRVQATALQMATVAAAIGLRGRRPHLSLDFDAADGHVASTERATSPQVARTMERLMLAVVRGGTGVRAAIPGVKVAGKTGTAELKSTKRCQPDPANPAACPPEQQVNDPKDTDAWFAAYAPAGTGHPRIAVGVLLVSAGAGGDTAAPVARDVLLEGLKRSKG